MEQADINRAVARVTNESITTIRRYGFSIVEAPADFKLTDADLNPDSELTTEGASRDAARC